MENITDKILNNLNYFTQITDTTQIPYQLEHIAEYYELLSKEFKNIDSILDIEYKLLSSFETIYLTLLDKLIYYRGEEKNKIQHIFENNNLCDFFIQAAILNNDPSLFKKYSRRRFFESSVSILLPLISFTTSISPPDDANKESKYIIINDETIFQTKSCLLRLSQLLRFMANKDKFLFDDTFDEFKDHYNFDLVNVDKLLYLISVLKTELSNNDDNPRSQLLLAKLKKIEAEIKKKNKIKWSFVITSVFVIFGFIADLKTLAPEKFNNAAIITENIISALHQDPQVDRNFKNNQNLLLDMNSTPTIEN